MGQVIDRSDAGRLIRDNRRGAVIDELGGCRYPHASMSTWRRSLTSLGLVLAFVPGMPFLAVHNHLDLRTGAFSIQTSGPVIRSVERCGNANHLHSYSWTYQERCPACLLNLGSQAIKAPSACAKTGIPSRGAAAWFRSPPPPQRSSRLPAGRAPPFATIV